MENGDLLKVYIKVDKERIVDIKFQVAGCPKTMKRKSNKKPSKEGGKLMKVGVSSNGRYLDSMLDPRMGRCDYFLIVDSESKEFQVVDNSAANASGGAGIKAAQTLLDSGVEAVITGNVGPNAWEILQAAGIKVYKSVSTTVESAIKAFNEGTLEVIEAAGPAHGGLRMG